MIVLEMITSPTSKRLVQSLGCGEHLQAHFTLVACIQVFIIIDSIIIIIIITIIILLICRRYFLAVQDSSIGELVSQSAII